MQELEKILEEIENTFKENIENIEDENGVHHFVIDSFTATFLAKEIIRKHMNDKSETYAFDFANTESFDCPCGRHYVHLAIPPKLEFCEKCKEKVRNNRTDICPKCRKKLYEYEKKYNCVVDIGMNGCDGARGGEIHPTARRKEKK